MLKVLFFVQFNCRPADFLPSKRVIFQFKASHRPEFQSAQNPDDFVRHHGIWCLAPKLCIQRWSLDHVWALEIAPTPMDSDSLRHSCTDSKSMESHAVRCEFSQLHLYPSEIDRHKKRIFVFAEKMKKKERKKEKLNWLKESDYFLCILTHLRHWQWINVRFEIIWHNCWFICCIIYFRCPVDNLQNVQKSIL